MAVALEASGALPPGTAGFPFFPFLAPASAPPPIAATASAVTTTMALRLRIPSSLPAVPDLCARIVYRRPAGLTRSARRANLGAGTEGGPWNGDLDDRQDRANRGGRVPRAGRGADGRRSAGWNRGGRQGCDGRRRRGRRSASATAARPATSRSKLAEIPDRGAGVTGYFGVLDSWIRIGRAMREAGRRRGRGLLGQRSSRPARGHRRLPPGAERAFTLLAKDNGGQTGNTSYGTGNCRGGATRFSDETLNFISNFDPPTIQPARSSRRGSLTVQPQDFPLAIMDGGHARGRWTLHVEDDQAGDTFTLNCWWVRISRAARLSGAARRHPGRELEKEGDRDRDRPGRGEHGVRRRSRDREPHGRPRRGRSRDGPGPWRPRSGWRGSTTRSAS